MSIETMIDRYIMIDDLWFYKGATVKYSFALLPKRCLLSGKLIWLKKGYKLTRMITGPGDPVYMYRWHDRYEHLLWRIRS
jgi:hypothetical protein